MSVDERVVRRPKQPGVIRRLIKVCSYTRETVEETERISDKIHALVQSTGRV